MVTNESIVGVESEVLGHRKLEKAGDASIKFRRVPIASERSDLVRVIRRHERHGQGREEFMKRFQ